MYFTCLFINYQTVNDNFYHLLLSDKILSEAKTFITSHATNNKLKEFSYLLISVL